MSASVDRRPAESPTFPRVFRPRMRRVAAPIDAVAFLNVLLVGVLFYLLRVPFVLQPGIRVDLPESAFTDGQPYDSLVVTVSQEGMLFFNDRRVTLEDLRTEFRKALHDRSDRTLILDADRRVSHGTLVNLFNLAMECGMRTVSLGTRVAASAEAAPP